MKYITFIIASLILGLCTFWAGKAIGDGFYKGRQVTRYVTVKGLSERFVQADIAEWPLQLTAADNDLSAARTRLESDLRTLTDFLVDAGVDQTQIVRQRLQVVDQLAERYNNSNIRNNRFIITQTILIKSSDVDLILDLSRRTSDLVAKGVVVQDTAGPSFTFTGLSAIKPEMVAEATRDARSSAERFAEDSESVVGPILKANQGYFQILPAVASNPYASNSEQIDKKVRVVTTIDFRLED